MGEAAQRVIETAAAADVPAVADLLARAFRDNPGFVGILRGDGPEQRQRVLEGCMRGFCSAVLRSGTIELIRDGGAPVATMLSFAAGQYPLPPAGQLIVAGAVMRARLARTHRFLRADLVMQRQHPREPHAYLWFLGSDPEHQGRGLGSQLLRAFTARCDAARTLGYLETDRERNVRLYERHGFTVVRDAIVPGMDSRMWFMQRRIQIT